MLKGIDVILYETTQSTSNNAAVVDGFNRPVLTETAVTVHNVLVAPSSSQEVIDKLQIEGKRAIYTLAIPKGDTHDWKNKKVQFFGQTFKTFGEPIKGIDDMIPLEWNAKVTVALYE